MVKKKVVRLTIGLSSCIEVHEIVPVDIVHIAHLEGVELVPQEGIPGKDILKVWVEFRVEGVLRMELVV